MFMRLGGVVCLLGSPHFPTGRKVSPDPTLQDVADRQSCVACRD